MTPFTQGQHHPRFHERRHNLLTIALTVAILASCVFLSVRIRTANLPQLEERYLLGTDGYLFLRQAEMIVSQGHLPATDSMRWVPLGRDLTAQSPLFPYALAFSYRLLHRVFGSFSLYQVALYSPVALYALCLLSLYFVWKRLFDGPIALLAVNLLTILPSLNLHRSMAGFADRDTF